MRNGIITLILTLCVAPSLMAQMMPDSTVQITAYWDKGDKVVYNVTQNVKQVSKDGTEKVLSSASEKDTFEVIDQTDTSYIVRMTMDDVVSSSITEDVDKEFSNIIAKEFKLDFRTDEYGELKSFYNLYPECERMKGLIPDVRDAFIQKAGKKLDKEKQERVRAIAQNYCDIVCEPDNLFELTLPTISRLLEFHGCVLDTTKLYTIKETIKNVYGHDFEVDQEEWVDETQSDSTYVVIRTSAQIDNDTLMPYLEEKVMQGLKEATASEDEFQEAWDEWLEEAISQHFQVVTTQYKIWVIHLPSGWPVQYGEKLVVSLKSDEEEVNTINTYDILIADVQ